MIYDNLHLFKTRAIDVFNWTAKEDPNLEIESGFISRKLGLSMYAPMLSILAPDEDPGDSEDKLPAQGFYVFRPGLYEEQRARVERFNAERAGKRS